MEQIRKANNDHQNLLNYKCYAMLNSEHYVDCTIVADGRFLKAHKLVLAAASGYFKEIFDIIPDRHPAIVLKDVKYTQLQHVMQYIYCGTVDVPSEDVESFRLILESLKIVFEQETPDSSEPPSPAVPEPENDIDIAESFIAGVKVKEEPCDDWPGGDDSHDSPEGFLGFLHPGESASNKSDHPPRRHSMYSPLRNKIPAVEGKVHIDRVVPSKKIQAFMMAHQLLCPFCKKYFKTNKHRNEHVKYCFDNPNRIVSQCPLCDKSVCDPYYLRKHMRNVHGTAESALINFPPEFQLEPGFLQNPSSQNLQTASQSSSLS